MKEEGDLRTNRLYRIDSEGFNLNLTSVCTGFATRWLPACPPGVSGADHRTKKGADHRALTTKAEDQGQYASFCNWGEEGTTKIDRLTIRKANDEVPGDDGQPSERRLMIREQEIDESPSTHVYD